MNFFLFHFEKKDKDQQFELKLLSVHETHHDITEGSEFLDDSIRTTDQPLMYTEKSVAPESLQGLWE